MKDRSMIIIIINKILNKEIFAWENKNMKLKLYLCININLRCNYESLMTILKI